MSKNSETGFLSYVQEAAQKSSLEAVHPEPIVKLGLNNHNEFYF
jgi:hypothetical protein